MPIVSLANQVVRPGAVNPPYATTTYSNSGKSVGLISAGTLIDSLAFNDIPAGRAMTGIFVQLSAVRLGTGVNFACDRAYNGVQFAVIYKDRSSTLFTCATGTFAQTLVNNDYMTVTPNLRRLVSLGYV
jgi:hypothetical protein